jgi:hypothetical protein
VNIEAFFGRLQERSRASQQEDRNTYIVTARNRLDFLLTFGAMPKVRRKKRLHYALEVKE